MTALPVPTTGDVLRLAARRWRRLLACSLAGLVLAALWLALSPARYSASLIVAPAATLLPDPTDRPTGVAGAVLVELGLGEVGGGEFNRFLDLLRTVEIARQLAELDGLMPALFPDQWDAADGAWRPSPALGDRLDRLADRLTGRPGWTPPGPLDLARRIDRLLIDQPVGSSDLRRLTVRHPDREVALRLLAALHATTDAHLRALARHQSAGQIAYLQEQLDRTVRTDHRQALTALLTRQEQRSMLIHGEPAYAARIVDGPVAPARPDWPPPLPILALALALGLLVGFGWVLVEALTRRGAAPEPPA